MTYNLINEADDPNPQSYEALLVKAYLFLLNKDGLDEVKDQIVKSFQILTQDSNEWKKFREDFESGQLNLEDSQVLEKTLFAMVTNNQKKEDYLKAFVFYSLKERKSQLDSFFKHISLEKSQEQKDSLLTQIRAEYKKFFTNGQFVRRLKELYVKDLANIGGIQAEFDV